MGSDGALREDVIAALRARPGVSVIQLPNGALEVSTVDSLRTFPLKATVSRGLLTEFCRYYGVTMAAFYPPLSRIAKKHAG